MEAKDVTHLFSKGYFKELVEFNKEVKWYGKTAIIDTNYLIQINREDLTSMFFERDYEEKISNPLKKQMAKLFRSHTKGELALFFSNSIFREFIYISPDKVDLVLQYNKYLFRIGSKRQFEPFFLDLASLLNLRARETGHKADLVDTYSFIISTLAGIDYFITEDSDLKGIFDYVNGIRNSSYLHKVGEINKLMKLSAMFFNIEEKDFPLKKIIEYLFQSKEKLTIPINIKGIADTLTKVSEKVESVVALCEMVNQIEEQKAMLNKEHMSPLAKARELINEICKSIQLEMPKPEERINVGNLSINLIEKDGLWKKPAEVDEIHTALFQVIQDIYDKIYGEEEEEGYETLEEYFVSSLLEIEVKAKCKCGHKFETYIYYGGVVAREEREMSSELLHVWNNEFNCLKCGEFLEIELRLREYPIGLLNYIEFDSKCEILNEDEIFDEIGIIPS